MNKLKTRLILLTMGGSIFAILLVSLITNFTFFKEFDMYMESTQEQKVEEVLNMIYQAYTMDEGWSSRALEYINFSPLVNNFDLVIKDENDKVILTNLLDDNMMDHHNNMMGRMGRGMGMGHNMGGRMGREPGHHRMGRGMMGRDYDNSHGHNNYNSGVVEESYPDTYNNGVVEDEIMENLARSGNYIKQSYVLDLDNVKLATIDIGYMGPFNISESDIGFTRGINRSIFYAALISILISIILGLYSSRVFSKPILKITEAANNIRKGHLDTIAVEDNKIVELKELSSSINHLSQSLEEQGQLRKRLTSDISHELRTPLTVLQSHIEALIDGVWEPTEERLNVCKNEVIRLIKLVEQLKYLTDIESHKIELDKEDYNLSSDMAEIVESFKYQFAEKEVSLNSNIERDLFIRGDRDKIKQIIINLLSNAFKFTNKNGHVGVSLKDKGQEVAIVVEDNGIGIDEKDIPYLFERLYRSDTSRNRKTGGTGIGLTITKTLVNAHGGNIGVESQKDKGTKMTVSLPKI